MTPSNSDLTQASRCNSTKHPRRQSKSSRSSGLASLVVALALVILAFVAYAPKPSAAAPGFDSDNGPRLHRRGFKSSMLSSARGFGKRSVHIISSPSAETTQQFMSDLPLHMTRFEVPTAYLAERACMDPQTMAQLMALIDVDDDGRVTSEEMAPRKR